MLRRKLRKDNLGTASFALLGVLIILLSMMAVAYISYLENLNYEERLRTDRISALEGAADKSIDSIKSKLHAMGVQSAFDGNSGLEIDNSTELFRCRLDDYIESSRSWERGGYRVVISEETNVTMQYGISEVDVIVPTANSRGRFERVETDIPGEIEKGNRSFHYELQGKITVTAEDRDTGMFLNRSEDIKMTIDVPYPFLRNKIDDFENEIRGSESNVARITRYILTNIAQYRTLMGYGMREFESFDNSSRSGTEDILTMEDVEIALNLAIMLEMAYQYRTFDQDALQALVDNTTVVGIVSLEILIDAYINRGRVDPGDLVALFYGYGYDNDTVSMEHAKELDIGAIIAQGLYAIADQFVIQYLEYFKIIPIANMLLRGVMELKDLADRAAEIGGTVLDVLTFWDDDDEIEINPKQVSTVKNWVEEIFISSGLMNTHIIREEYLPYHTIDGESIHGYPSLPEDFSRTYEMKFKTRLVGEEHRLYRYSCGHGDVHRKRGDTCSEMITVTDSHGDEVEVRCGAQEIIAGYDYMIHTVRGKIQGGPILYEPVDILEGDDEIWQKFYTDSYSQEGDNEIEEIQDILREVIITLVESITEQPAVRAIIARYNKVEVDVNSRRSIFNEIDDAIGKAIRDTMDFYRENPDRILDILQEYFQGGDPKVEDLKELLKENYHSFHGEDHVDITALRTAEALVGQPGFISFEVINTRVYEGKLNEAADATDIHTSEPSEEDLRNILLNGGVLTDEKVSSLKISLKPHVETGLDMIKEREISEVNFQEIHHQGDGLLIQALDSYQYNTTVRPVIRDERTRSGGYVTTSVVSIYDIHPSPATRGQDTVRFMADISTNVSHIEWISNRDGHLSNLLDFNISALFLSAGEHQITLRVTDNEGYIHQDIGWLFVNRPPVAVIDELPHAISENQSIMFSQNSYDIDGEIVEYFWDFGDGNSSSSKEATHIYRIPGEYKITLTVIDDMGGTDSAFASILVDNRPRVLDISPTDGTDWDTKQPITVKFSEEVDTDSLEYSVYPSVEYSVSWSDDNTVAIFEPEHPYERYSYYELVIHDILDVDNGTQSSLEFSVVHGWFTREYAKVVSYYPSEDRGIEIQRSIVLSFDESVMLVKDIHEFVLEDHHWEYTFEEDHTKLILDHQGFPSGEEVVLNFDMSCLITRYDGSPVSVDGKGDTSFSISFVTEHREMPLLLYSYPTDNCTDVALDTMLKFEFSRAMNTSSLSVIISPTIHGLNYSWNDDNSSLWISHGGLHEDTTYRVNLGIQDDLGNELLATNEFPDTFSFRTQGKPPTVLAMSPEDGQTRYLTNAPIVIIFSKSMNPDSLDFSMDPDPGHWFQEWNQDMTRLNLHHDNFDSGIWYDFVLHDAKDRCGNSIEDKVEVSFLTSHYGNAIEGNLMERRLWSIVGGGLMRDSLFDIAEELITMTTSSIVLSSHMNNLEVRLPMSLEEPFEYGSHHGENAREMEFEVSYDPGYIELTEDIISQPEGVHYTDILTISSRPFETYWEISLPSTGIRLNISCPTHTVLEGSGHKDIQIDRNMNIEFDIRVTIFSGWGLAGVDYTLSDDIFSGIRSFIQEIWDRLIDAFSYLLDGIRNLIDAFKNIVQTVKDQAVEMVEFIGEVTRYVVHDLIAPRVRDMVTRMDLDELEDMDRRLSLLGLDLGVSVREDGVETGLPMHQDSVTRYVNITMGSSLRGTSYRLNVNVLRDNVILFGDISIGAFSMDWQMDPLSDPNDHYHGIYPAWFQAQGRIGEKGDGALLNITVPSISEPKDDFKLALSSVVPINTVTIPIGPVVVTGIDLGAKITVSDIEESGLSLIHGTMGNVFRDTAENMGSESFNLDYIVRYIKNLLHRFVEELLSLIQNFVQELILFFNVVISGVEVALSFGITCSEAIFEFFRWVAETVRELIVESISQRRIIAPSTSFPTEIIEATELGIAIGQADTEVYFDVNLPALAALVNRDIGRWSIGFGVKVPEMTLVKGELTQW